MMMNIRGGEVVGSTMTSPSSKTNEVVNVNGCSVSVTDEFPVGLRVLVVDDDLTCLTVLEKMLRTCRYQVTKTSRAEVALSLLRENRNGFDVIISDVHMPDMDGFKLLECVGLEMDLPVIMMSADDSKHVVMKGVRHGACDYLIKPIRIEALKTIWQHVVRKKKTEFNVEQSGSWDDEGDTQQKQDDSSLSSPASEGWKSSKRKGDDEDELDEKDDSTTLKKPRVVWSVELHQQFVAAVNQLGIDKAVPKKILDLMNVPGLTRENVASHLQKYRLYLRRVSVVSQHQGRSFMSHDSGFSSMSSLGGIDLQTLAATGQLSAQALAAYARMTPGIKPGMSMPFVDQRNLFSFENSKLRYGEGQQQLGNINKQMNLLQGIPTNMEPKQLVGLTQSGQTLGNLNLQPNQSGSLLAMQSRNGIPYNSVSQATSVVDFSVNHVPDLARNGFPLGNTPGITSMNSEGFNQEESSSNVKATRIYNSSYDVLSEFQQHKSPDWQLINPGMSMTFGQSSMNVAPSVVGNQPYKTNVNANALGYSFNGLGDNLSRVKRETISEVVSSGTNLFSEHYGRDDLMSAVLKQQRECVVPGELHLDGCAVDGFPM